MKKLFISKSAKRGFVSAFSLKRQVRSWPSTIDYSYQDAKAMYDDWRQVGKDIWDAECKVTTQ